MNLQELFNLVWERAKDKRKALVGNFCVYRSVYTGLCCFLGVAIPPDKVKPRWQTMHQGDARDEAMEAAGLHRDLLVAVFELQRIHDCQDPNFWEKALIQYANERGLTVPGTNEAMAVTKE